MKKDPELNTNISDEYKRRDFVVLTLQFDYDKYAKYAFLKIRRIKKYEYAFPKYAWTKGRYAHIWLEHIIRWVRKMFEANCLLLVKGSEAF